jgi:hypothetical protein
MITAQMAIRLRQRGLLLRSNAEFENPRLKEIAEQQEKLFAEIDKLDKEIKQLANQT